MAGHLVLILTPRSSRILRIPASRSSAHSEQQAVVRTQSVVRCTCVEAENSLKPHPTRPHPVTSA
eukprot:15462694-Alexandrium_andersonii.AAC.1